MNFSLKLKGLRESKGISQRELATTLQVGVGSVGMWESTDRMPNAKQLVSIAKYFKITTDYLLGLEDDYGAKVATPTPPITMSDKEKALLEAFRQLLPETQDFILRTAQSLKDKRDKLGTK